MDRLKDRYFIRYNTKSQLWYSPPTCKCKNTNAGIHSFQVMMTSYRIRNLPEDYFSKGVSKMERKNGTLTAGNKQTLRQKVLGESASAYEQLTNQFQEGLYDPEKDGKYEGKK